MDASISDDPFAPDPPALPPVDEATFKRWKRVGAEDIEIPGLAIRYNAAEVDDTTLAAYLEEYRADTPPSTDETPEVTEAEAIAGPWADAAPLTIDGVEYRTWTLDGGWVAILAGDEHNGVHLVGYGVEGVTEKLASEIHSNAQVAVAQAHADVAAWQAAKHLADAQARATA